MKQRRQTRAIHALTLQVVSLPLQVRHLVGYILRNDAIHTQLEKGLNGENRTKRIVETLFHPGQEAGNEKGGDNAARGLNDTSGRSIGYRLVNTDFLT